jgi:hypothetical protein
MKVSYPPFPLALVGHQVINANLIEADQQIHIPNCTGYTFLAYAVQIRSSVQRNAFGEIK